MDKLFQSKCCALLLDLGRQVRTALRDGMAAQGIESLQEVAHTTAEDTLYQLDLAAEPVILHWARRAAKAIGPLHLVAEGLGESTRIVPTGTPPEKLGHVVIVDPIDGTRGLMVDKRPAWFLAAVAPTTGTDRAGLPTARLRDIVAACMVELPTTKMHLADELWATTDDAQAHARRVNLLTDESAELTLQPSGAATIEHGFATLAKFFPGGKPLAAQIEEELFERLIGPPRPGRGLVFDDQYISTGGQFYELAAGHDRFIADLRPLIHNALPGGVRPLTAHPYDVCTELVLRKAGCIVVVPDGSPLDGPLDLTTEMAWAGYANRTLYDTIHPILLDVLRSNPTIGFDGWEVGRF